MFAHTSRYLIMVNEWGFDLHYKRAYKSFFRSYTENCETIEAVNESINMLKEIYADVEWPDVKSYRKYKSTKSMSRNEIMNDERLKLEKYLAQPDTYPYARNISWIFDATHYWYGWVVFDFEKEEIFNVGGKALKDYEFPLKSLRLKDLAFTREDEIPKDYKWDAGEYDGWLQFRYGNGLNAIEIEDERNRKAAEKKEEYRKKQQEKQDSSDNESEYSEFADTDDYNDIQEQYDDELDKATIKYNMERFGW